MCRTHYTCFLFTVFAHMARLYVNAIDTGAIPCVQSALEVAAAAENAIAISNALQHYKDVMKERVSLPAETKTLSKVNI